MLGPYTRETIENWVGDFVHSDAIDECPTAVHEFAPQILTTLIVAACEARDVEPGEIEEADLRAALLDHVAPLDIPPAARSGVPDLCAAFLTSLESAGRLADGHVLGAFVRALRGPFAERATGKPKPITRPGSRIGRNDPCPCGSGKKYKKCCMGE